ncbi:hypothetical protein HK104_010697 [Borealophlyctis nickersoniae]|nr:hypothetical protein HK104_010697 [Borealophlyctis nickersoniae]
MLSMASTSKASPSSPTSPTLPPNVVIPVRKDSHEISSTGKGPRALLMPNGSASDAEKLSNEGRKPTPTSPLSDKPPNPYPLPNLVTADQSSRPSLDRPGLAAETEPIFEDSEPGSPPPVHVPAPTASGATDDANGERIVRMLCDYENGLDLLLSRVRQDIQSSKEALTFLRRRAAIEEEYARSMMKLAQSTPMQIPEGKEGTYADTWARFVKMHESIGEIRLGFATAIHEVSDEMLTLSTNAERSRKQLREAGYKQLRMVQDADVALEKAKIKYDATSEEWERAILMRDQAGESDTASTISSSSYNGSGTYRFGQLTKAGLKKGALAKNLFKQGGAYNKYQKAEDDARHKAALANESYKIQLHQTNLVRNSFFKAHLPRFVRLLKETNDECDQGLQYHLARYAQELERSLMQEATLISPLEKEVPGLVKVIEQIDNERDFEDFMNNYLKKQKQLRKADHIYLPYSMSTDALSIANPKPSFGVPITSLMERDVVPVPYVVSKCIKCVEKYGMKAQGLYRVSGTNTHVQKLKGLLDRDVQLVNMDEWAVDIHNITGVLKLFFRELPDSLFPKSMYYQFNEAAKIEDDRRRLIGIHELINQLHDANYATLKALAGHLHRVQSHEEDNKMSFQNLSIVWGPTLMDQPDNSKAPDPSELKLQSLVVETVLANFEQIFDADEEV